MHTEFSPAETPAVDAIMIGALAPLTRPGWTEAGRHLLAGMELAASELNAAGGIHGRPLTLVVRDTAADPAKAAAAVEELAQLGVAAIIGEYHSVVARTVAAKADEMAVPFLCTSAVLDALLDRPSPWVARIAPPQSSGWRLYADFLLERSHVQVAVAIAPNVYWTTGTGFLRERLAGRGGNLTEIDVRMLTPAAVCDALAASRATALLLLAGFPDPTLPIATAVRADPRLKHVMLGAPAGQPEFNEWQALPNADSTAIPFLRYLPRTPGPLAQHILNAVRERLAEAPSFVALEGYDAVLVIADLLRRVGPARKRIADAWPQVATTGTRGTIRFSRPDGMNLWQWQDAPIQVAERDPADPTSFRTLYGG